MATRLTVTFTLLPNSPLYVLIEENFQYFGTILTCIQ